ncbi:MAG: transcriptional regulator, partial [Mesorhizobium sp.]
RPIGRPRAAAADLARRIAAQAGLATEKLEAFLQDDA